MKVLKKDIAEYVRHQLKTNEKWAKAALLTIYEYQTKDEQLVGYTKEYNNVGFSGVDSEIMSSFAEQLINKGWLSPKQMAIVMKRIHRYTRQIISVSDMEMLKKQTLKYIS
jgi:glucan phosphorylase